jgi:hypothetical protein
MEWTPEDQDYLDSLEGVSLASVEQRLDKLEATPAGRAELEDAAAPDEHGEPLGELVPGTPPGLDDSRPWPPRASQTGDVLVYRDDSYKTHRAYRDGDRWRWEALGTVVMRADRWRPAPEPQEEQPTAYALAIERARSAGTELVDIVDSLPLAGSETREETVVAQLAAFEAEKALVRTREALKLAREATP